MSMQQYNCIRFINTRFKNESIEKREKLECYINSDDFETDLKIRMKAKNYCLQKACKNTIMYYYLNHCL